MSLISPVKALSAAAVCVPVSGSESLLAFMRLSGIGVAWLELASASHSLGVRLFHPETLTRKARADMEILKSARNARKAAAKRCLAARDVLGEFRTSHNSH